MHFILWLAHFLISVYISTSRGRFYFLWHILVHLSLDLKQLLFVVSQLDLQLHDIISITDFDIGDFVIIMGVRVLFCSSSMNPVDKSSWLIISWTGIWAFFHTCACRNALDICSLAASLVGGISSGLFIIRMRSTRIESSEVANLSLYKRHINFSTRS